jgi:predicted permease
MRLRARIAGTIVLTLGLGVGVNGVMYDVIDRLLLRSPAHVRQPERLVAIEIIHPSLGGGSAQSPAKSSRTSYPVLEALRTAPAFSGVAGTFTSDFTLGRGAEAERVQVGLVSGNFFQLLGAAPEVGQFFGPSDDLAPFGASVAVLSHGFSRRFRPESSAIGRVLLIEGRAFTVIGVAPKEFNGLELAAVDLWLPLSALAPVSFGKEWRTDERITWVSVIGRLLPDVGAERAGADATVVVRRTARASGYLERDTLARAIARPVVGRPAWANLSRDLQITLWLAGVSSLVLVISCANICNLLLVRALQRRHEIAVRIALGMTLARFARQMLSEAMVLAAAATIPAVVVAYLGMRVVRLFIFPEVAWGDSTVSAGVLGFTAIVCAVTAAAASMAPAFQARSLHVARSLSTAARSTGGIGARLRSGLLAIQIALSVILVAGAGLFVRSLQNVQAVDVGVDLPRVLLVRPDLSTSRVSGSEIRELFERARDRVSRIRSIESTALVSGSVPMGRGNIVSLRVPGRDSLQTRGNGGPVLSGISASYFTTLGSQLLRGRPFSEGEESAGARVAVLNESLARNLWPEADPIGDCLMIGNEVACTTVVGVIEDVLLFKITGDPRGQVFVPITHPFVTAKRPGALIARVREGSQAPIDQTRREVHALDPSIAYVKVERFSDLVSPEIRPWRLGATLFGTFGLLALSIATIGIYSVVSLAVSQGAREIGVRRALGARGIDILRFVLLSHAPPIVGGFLVGTTAALALARLIGPLLYETSPFEPGVHVSVIALLVAVTAIACAGPAWKAARVEPSIVLQAD